MVNASDCWGGCNDDDGGGRSVQDGGGVISNSC